MTSILHFRAQPHAMNDPNACQAFLERLRTFPLNQPDRSPDDRTLISLFETACQACQSAEPRPDQHQAITNVFNLAQATGRLSYHKPTPAHLEQTANIRLWFADHWPEFDPHRSKDKRADTLLLALCFWLNFKAYRLRKEEERQGFRQPDSLNIPQSIGDGDQGDEKIDTIPDGSWHDRLNLPPQELLRMSDLDAWANLDPISAADLPLIDRLRHLLNDPESRAKLEQNHVRGVPELTNLFLLNSIVSYLQITQKPALIKHLATIAQNYQIEPAKLKRYYYDHLRPSLKTLLSD